MSAPATPITPKPMEGVAGQRVGEGDKEPVDRGGGSMGHPAASQRLDSSACLQCHPRPAGVSKYDNSREGLAFQELMEGEGEVCDTQLLLKARSAYFHAIPDLLV